MRTTMTIDLRLAQLVEWLLRVGAPWQINVDEILPASADASFRRYFRVRGHEGQSFIVMDAPPAQENLESFIAVTKLMHEAGLNAPQILAINREDGFLLLSDLGTKTYLDVLNEDNAFALMDRATTALVQWQKISRPNVLPEYDASLLNREMRLYPRWYLKCHKNYTFNADEQKWWQMTKDALIASHLKEAKVFVHRDFMPRNLMLSEVNPGILDYQDAVYGPISYDITCLLKDAFISWNETFVLDVTIRYWEKARKAGLPVPKDFARFYRDIEFMGVQRHLKVLGIFARIRYRDGKPKYLRDAPRFIQYLRSASQRYLELSPLRRIINNVEGSNITVGYTF